MTAAGGPGDRREAVLRGYRAFNARDLEALRREVSDDFEWHPNPDDPEQAPRRTWDAVEEATNGIWDALERLTTEVEELLDAPPHVVASVRHTAVLHGTDAEITRTEVHVWSFDDRGRIHRLREFPERAAARVAAGLGV